MRSWIVPALLVIKWPFIVDGALSNPAQYLEPRQGRETGQEFDQTTASFKQQGLCRLYLGLKRGRTGLEICEPKCGDLARKAQKTGGTTSVSCFTGGDNIPTYTDPMVISIIRASVYATYQSWTSWSTTSSWPCPR